ncbi:MAG: hypothetical protein A3A24_03250 [Candidatus Buchananbacteria bacterium RIFCSPLOWO2_01_FULL_46_12]|uniref:Uncharacterized protein n=1 Tax=Candidatus Buchananbacteria bacterium RIFCSPLOWO2_01_FULL_46_12 TaxID=1797546 RepID=A0A1G1YNR3_9BACT|nr:MAG: hypothetical protein A3A24_03250 [Candidatus Buchananbacteria bacterium RIFCSPLOWO2_01_FULL_46_12]
MSVVDAYGASTISINTVLTMIATIAGTKSSRLQAIQSMSFSIANLLGWFYLVIERTGEVGTTTTLPLGPASLLGILGSSVVETSIGKVFRSGLWSGRTSVVAPVGVVEHATRRTIKARNNKDRCFIKSSPLNQLTSRFEAVVDNDSC